MLQARTDWRWFLSLGLILGSIGGLNLYSHGSAPVRSQQLSSFPATIGPWSGRDIPIDERVLDVLKASDVLNRVYIDSAGVSWVGVFVAYYDSQRRGGAIHSPKNCLPGAGWNIVQGNMVPITLSGRSETAQVNQVLIQNGMNKQLVLYWYQSQGRIVASEYTAKICLLWDAATKNRTDGAIVRIVVPVTDGNEEAALKQAREFLGQAYPELRELIPS
jgi:EpsI family protein